MRDRDRDRERDKIEHTHTHIMMAGAHSVYPWAIKELNKRH